MKEKKLKREVTGTVEWGKRLEECKTTNEGYPVHGEKNCEKMQS